MEVTADSAALKPAPSGTKAEIAARAEPFAAQGDGRGHRDRRKGLFDRFGFWLFLVTVVLAPIPDGSVAPLWIQIWISTVAISALAISYRDVSRGAAALIWGLTSVVAVYVLVVWLQSVSPGPRPLAIWANASKVLGIELAPLSSSVRGTPLIFLGRPLLAALVLIVAIAIGPQSRRAALVLRAIVGAACLYGAIGLFGLLASIDALRPFDQSGALTTFFLNKNTSATYLGTAFLLAFSILLPSFNAALRERRPVLTMFRGAERRRRIAAAFAGFLFLILLPLTLSRAGTMLTVVVALACLALKLELRKRAGLWQLVLSIFVLFSFIFAISGESWYQRHAHLGFDSLGRLDAYMEMLRASLDHPLLGLGLGSFQHSFPQYRTEDLGLFGQFNIGHSTPVELIFEGGYPLALSVFAFVIVCGSLLIRGALRRPDDPYILAALLVGLLGLIHTSFDFSLQIPGYLMTFLVVVGMGIGRAFLPREERKIMKKKVVRRPTAPEPAGPLE
ncbi:O-antigen ligase family protein [Xanthobacter flavus]|uniref:O-antigen ligase family protein n=1 Tax=Xanthobacter flavus TaxID=281 RepID=UPI0037272786